MPFNNLTPSAPSDGHRMLWIKEVCNYSILGKEVPHNTKALTINGVPSKDPRKKKLFNQKVKKEYSGYDLFNILKKIKYIQK